MSFWNILDTIFLGPLKFVFEFIFSVAIELTDNIGLSIILLSLAMNILVLPLYMCADRMQEEARLMETKLHDGIVHIKKTFKGDERMMMLQAYYKQNHYSPLSALNGSVSLLLEIPFFMAAYQFLSNITILNGASLGPISNLAEPDAMIKIGSLVINILPILMTVINIVASVLYLKGAPLKSKIQLYAMAIFFLVFLYTSPSGLVFYWTLNNVFSLVKTILYKLKHPKRIIKILSGTVGGALLIVPIINYGSFELKLVCWILAIVLQLPWAMPLIKKFVTEKLYKKFNITPKEKAEPQPNRKMFMIGCVFATILLGLLIPSAYIAASPQEYVNTSLFYNPLKYVLLSTCMAGGVFLVWLQVFYWLANKKARVGFDKTIWVLSIVMLADYMFFGTNLGIVTSALQYENGLIFSTLEVVLNILVVSVLVIVLWLLVTKWKKLASVSLVLLIVAASGMSGVNIAKANKSINDINLNKTDKTEELCFNLSKTGQNVIVFMLDRAMGQYIPYIMKELPELKERFAGFTYYSNTISFSGSTNMAAPALLGGYEYTPVEINKRDTELLKDKNNEANLVMPVMFNNAGFDVTVSDPIYTNYQWISDLSIYDEYEGIKAFNSIGKFMDEIQIESMYKNNNKNFFRFSFMKTMPLFLQATFYDLGSYRGLETYDTQLTYTSQRIISGTEAYKISNAFMQNYITLQNLSNMTNVVEDGTNTFLFMRNDATHENMLLSEPTYTPEWYVNNTEYDKNNTDRFIVDGKVLKMPGSLEKSHYQCNVAALLQLANWFDYMRANDVYDNTRIILVSDHGYTANHLDELNVSGTDVGHYFPLLMVKDFNSETYTTNSEFMTNADVPTLAVAGLIENAKNPFTNKPINNAEKTAHPQYILLSGDWQININNKNSFLPGRWASVEKDLWNKNNWDFYRENAVLKSHEFPK